VTPRCGVGCEATLTEHLHVVHVEGCPTGNVGRTVVRMHDETFRALTRSHGFAALASDGKLGIVETPVFPPSVARPDYVIVRTQVPGRRSRRPVITVALVESVDTVARVVRFRGTVRELERLPQSLPVANLIRPFRR
jgi:hypothetical protein